MVAFLGSVAHFLIKIRNHMVETMKPLISLFASFLGLRHLCRCSQIGSCSLDYSLHGNGIVELYQFAVSGALPQFKVQTVAILNFFLFDFTLKMEVERACQLIIFDAMFLYVVFIRASSRGAPNDCTDRAEIVCPWETAYRA